MRRTPVLAGLVLLVLATSMATPTQAGTHPTKAKLVFSTPDFRWFSARDQGDYTLSKVGDFWTQSFTVPGFRAPRQFELFLSYSTTVVEGKQLAVQVVVNGQTLGDLAIGPCCLTGGVYFSSAVSGPSFNVLLLVDHGLDVGEGGVTLNLDGNSFLRMKL